MRLKTARWLSAALACAACTSLAREAHAQAQGFAVDQFEPSERGSDWFSVESLDLRGSLRPAIGVVMDGAYRPLVVYAPDGTIERSIVRNQIFAHAGASLVLWDRLRVGVEYRTLDDTIGGSPIGSQVLFGAAAGLRFFDHAFVIGPEIYGATIISNSNAFFTTQSTPLDGVLGAHLTLARGVRLGSAFGPGLTRGFGSPVFRWMASLEWAPAYEEATPEPVPTPEPPSDRDKDGVIDDDDACPDVAGVKTDDPKTNGCPPDRDKAGIADGDAV